MVVVFALIATLCLSLQGVLMTAVYRSHDPVVSIATRGLTLGVTMAPILYLARPVTIDEIRAGLPALLLAATLAAGANACASIGIRHLKVGVFHAIAAGVGVLVAMGFGKFLFDESVSYSQLLPIAVLLAANCTLASSRGGAASPHASQSRGVVLAVVFALLISSAFAIVGKLSRTLDPFITAYAWETGIGLVLFAGILIRSMISGEAAPYLSRGTMAAVAIRSAPTAVGTASYALATTAGKLGIVSAVNSCGVVFAALLSVGILGERLRPLQWACVVVVMVMLATLRAMV